MRAADLLPRALLPAAALLAGGWPDDAAVSRITGISREQWRAIGRAYPALGEDPGRRAARARMRLRFLIGRSLALRRHDARWVGPPLDERPTMFATAHLGDLRGLRYALRRRVPAANVVWNASDRALVAEDDTRFDRDSPHDFPHVWSAAAPHALRSALARGSLIAAADVPAPRPVEAGLLGGRVRLDPRPFRLARLARVPCRSIFLTAPGGRLRVTLGANLPAAEEEAVRLFAEDLARAARDAPFELDGPTRWGQLA